ncbi:unknown [Methanothermobacter thermautotrophicus str. Delta H]|uniref:Uncharacterized protein n=1 Tax=Methanothermobacter thermautotrophicus (strain ATCC 29096 / DSM 1053 / JCM 10044 / NBRC 100330 / Delta H) TaxID=187420 RepID=O27064_METTH|nr:hypothetical protein [Methanothermobacter thermautotrophicus]AAB85480.1 unknown [Methanothermobacter thermautotrophicus str. Delta H]
MKSVLNQALKNITSHEICTDPDQGLVVKLGELRKFVTSEFVFGDRARFLAGRYALNLGADRSSL